jgi:hypothetical protein
MLLPMHGIRFTRRRFALFIGQHPKRIQEYPYLCPEELARLHTNRWRGREGAGKSKAGVGTSCQLLDTTPHPAVVRGMQYMGTRLLPQRNGDLLVCVAGTPSPAEWSSVHEGGVSGRRGCGGGVGAPANLGKRGDLAVHGGLGQHARADAGARAARNADACSLERVVAVIESGARLELRHHGT